MEDLPAGPPAAKREAESTDRMESSDPILNQDQVQNLIEDVPVNNEEEEEEDEEEDDSSEEEDILATLPPEVVGRVEKLKELNDDRDKIMEDYLKERALLEHKYAALSKPLFDKRREIIGNGVPQFWSCCMSHLETVAELVTEQDVDCLEHLTDIRCEDFPDGKGFTLFFHFEPNEYFTNEVLTKRYEIPNLLLEDEPILKSVTGCDIHWNHQRCLTHREIQKKQRSKSGRRAGQIRTVTKREHTDSFFHFFNPPKMPALDDMDEDQADAIEEAFDHDYDVAQSFRSHIIPKAVLWFTGEALEEDALTDAQAAEQILNYS